MNQSSSQKVTDFPLRILLLEDNRNDTTLIKELLALSGVAHTLDHADLLTRGIGLAAERSYDVVLMDLSLPDSNRVQTFTSFHEHFPNAAVVLLSGHDEEQMANLAIDAGAQDFLVKGEFNPRQLARALRYAMNRHQTENALRKSQACLNNIIKSSIDMIIATDMKERILVFNPAAELAFSYSASEVLDKPVSILYASNGSNPPVLKITQLEGRWSGEVVNRKKSGETFPSLLTTSLLKDERGEVIGMMGISRAITR